MEYSSAIWLHGSFEEFMHSVYKCSFHQINLCINLACTQHKKKLKGTGNKEKRTPVQFLGWCFFKQWFQGGK
jgi:hypothetical protein